MKTSEIMAVAREWIRCLGYASEGGVLFGTATNGLGGKPERVEALILYLNNRPWGSISTKECIAAINKSIRVARRSER